MMVSYARQVGNRNEIESPSPFPAGIIQRIKELLEKRVEFVDIQEKTSLIKEIKDRIAEWIVWNPSDWLNGPKGEPSLLRYPDLYYPYPWEIKSWATPTSMRSVDAECRPEITQMYLMDNLEETRDQE